MSGISPDIMFSVTRVRTAFADDLGNRRGGTGTGFWVRVVVSPDEEFVPAFVTNRHNVDPAMHGLGAEYQLVESQIELRFHDGDDPGGNTLFVGVDVAAWKRHPTADCASVLATSLDSHPPDYAAATMLSWTDLASESWLRSYASPMDLASFVGFPGNGGKGWWDQAMNLPIARLASLASYPSLPFTHEDIKTADVGLVSGYSFQGSSGSPLIIHDGAKVVGIMSGHFKDDMGPPMFRHTGLSYYTRSTAILELLDVQWEAGAEQPFE